MRRRGAASATRRAAGAAGRRRAGRRCPRARCRAPSARPAAAAAPGPRRPYQTASRCERVGAEDTRREVAQRLEDREVEPARRVRRRGADALEPLVVERPGRSSACRTADRGRTPSCTGRHRGRPPALRSARSRFDHRSSRRRGSLDARRRHRIDSRRSWKANVCLTRAVPAERGTLRALGWDHPRCMSPMRACAERWQSSPGVDGRVGGALARGVRRPAARGGRRRLRPGRDRPPVLRPGRADRVPDPARRAARRRDARRR